MERERNTMVTAIESIRASTLDRDDEATTAAMYKLRTRGCYSLPAGSFGSA